LVDLLPDERYTKDVHFLNDIPCIFGLNLAFIHALRIWTSISIIAFLICTAITVG